MFKLKIWFLIFLFLLSFFPTSVFAQVEPTAPPADTHVYIIPFYVFATQEGGALAITRVAENQYFYAYATSAEKVETGLINPTGTATAEDTSTELGNQPVIPMGLLLVAVGSDPDAVNSFLETGEGVGQRIFTGHIADDSTTLQYFGARYYQGDVGRFWSEDPLFLMVGDWSLKDNWIPKLVSPQSSNSYSYANNNPVYYVDKDGNFSLPAIFALIGATAGFAKGVIRSTPLFVSSISTIRKGDSSNLSGYQKVNENTGQMLNNVVSDTVGGAAGGVSAAASFMGKQHPFVTGATTEFASRLTSDATSRALGKAGIGTGQYNNYDSKFLGDLAISGFAGWGSKMITDSLAVISPQLSSSFKVTEKIGDQYQKSNFNVSPSNISNALQWVSTDAGVNWGIQQVGQILSNNNNK